jgi:hypothetical protein
MEDPFDTYIDKMLDERACQQQPFVKDDVVIALHKVIDMIAPDDLIGVLYDVKTFVETDNRFHEVGSEEWVWKQHAEMMIQDLTPPPPLCPPPPPPPPPPLPSFTVEKTTVEAKSRIVKGWSWSFTGIDSLVISSQTNEPPRELTNEEIIFSPIVQEEKC